MTRPATLALALSLATAWLRSSEGVRIGRIQLEDRQRSSGIGFVLDNGTTPRARHRRGR